jgi:hypothetical protein
VTARPAPVRRSDPSCRRAALCPSPSGRPRSRRISRPSPRASWTKRAPFIDSITAWMCSIAGEGGAPCGRARRRLAAKRFPRGCLLRRPSRRCRASSCKGPSQRASLPAASCRGVWFQREPILRGGPASWHSVLDRRRHLLALTAGRRAALRRASSYRRPRSQTALRVARRDRRAHVAS